MAEFKVKSVSSVEEKSSQEIEAGLLKKHEEQQEDSVEVASEEPAESTPPESSKEETPEAPVEAEKKIGDADVLSYIKDRYNKDIKTVDELLDTTQSNEELPDEVITFLKYKKDTGRGIEDFVKLNRDLDSYDGDTLLKQYWKESNPHLDDEDIAFEMDSKFDYDEEYDEAAEVKKRKIAKKQELAKAKKYFENLKEQYKAPLESSGSSVPGEDKEGYEAYKQYVAESNTVNEQTEKKRDYFFKKTNDLFNTDFEGFKFKVGDKDLVFKPGDTENLKKVQSDVNNFIDNHLDDNGLLKDAAAYHRSLSVAMNPEAFASFFYEQGKADAVEDISKESKNIDMRKSPQAVSKGGFKVTGSTKDHGSRLVIRSNKKH